MGHFVDDGLAMQFVGQFNQSFIEGCDVGVIEFRPACVVGALISILLSQFSVVNNEVLSDVYQ